MVITALSQAQDFMLNQVAPENRSVASWNAAREELKRKTTPQIINQLDGSAFIKWFLFTEYDN